jgi:hypothetical protein
MDEEYQISKVWRQYGETEGKEWSETAEWNIRCRWIRWPIAVCYRHCVSLERVLSYRIQTLSFFQVIKYLRDPQPTRHFRTTRKDISLLLWQLRATALYLTLTSLRCVIKEVRNALWLHQVSLRVFPSVLKHLTNQIYANKVSGTMLLVTGWYRAKRPMHCGIFFIYCASTYEF